MKVISRKIRDMVKVRLFFQMEDFSKGYGKMIRWKDNAKSNTLQVTLIKETIRMNRRVEKEFSDSQMVLNIQVLLMMIFLKARGRSNI